ncbi:MAG: phosphoribosylformylglycinamidine cyclo-ligase [Armatimonadota bacterium]
MSTDKQTDSLTYADSGVAPADKLLCGLLRWVNSTLAFRTGAGTPRTSIGHYAAVLDLGANLGLAISTDGVGSKIIIAEMAGKYDTIGIDCVAMNANDVVCVGAEPIAMVDYIATESADADMLEQIGRGLHEGARQARITIPGGELAQLPDIIRGAKPGSGFDLVGTCVGLVALDRLVLGNDIAPGDVLIGIASSGIHSNGMSLARKALFERAGMRLDDTPGCIGRTLAEELLEPTRIYVPWVVDMLKAGVPIRGLAHITGDGLLNLRRIGNDIGWEIDWLPDPPPIFRLIQEAGGVSTAEMYRVFNMGVGFCVVVPEDHVSTVTAHLGAAKVPWWRLGHAVADPSRSVVLKPCGLRSVGDEFVPT